jgi:putative sterol carrier protein
MTAKEFIHNLPQQVNKEGIQGMETTFHFQINGEGGGDYTVEVKDGQVIINEGLIGNPKCTVRTTNDNFIGVVTGKINPMMALMMGKIKIDNQGELLKYAKVFGLMK